jgi:hypothetical protein
MVKNNAGGNKGKGLARKHVNAAANKSGLRVANDEAERYAVVSKMLGNGMCYVRLLGAGTSGDVLCIIRNKFKGRGKRDNILDSGSWVLVGLREWASKQDTCDLLEVYNDGERERLMKNEPCFKGVANESSGNTHSSSVQFADSTTLKYSKLVKEADESSDDEDDLQQRVYDMPSDSDSETGSEDDDDDNDNDDDEPVVVVVVPVRKAVALPTNHINVDDI